MSKILTTDSSHTIIGPITVSNGVNTMGPIGVNGIYHPQASAQLIEAKKKTAEWANDSWRRIDNLLVVLDKLDLL